jgi:hypothetical protein
MNTLWLKWLASRRWAPLALLLVTGCGLISTEPAAQLLMASGDGQDGEAGQELAAPIGVKVVDARGKAVAGQGVTFRVSAGDGQVFSGFGTSDSKGLVHERWTLGTVAGAEQTLAVRAVSSTGEALPELTFHATAQAGPPKTLVILNASEAQSLSRGDHVQLQLQARDAYGNGVPPERVQSSWSSSAEAVATVDASGLVQAVAGGETTLTVRSGEASAELVLKVAYLRATLHEAPGAIQGFYEAGNQLFAYGKTLDVPGVGAVWRWTGTAWERQPGSLGSEVLSVWSFPNGETWAAGRQGTDGTMPVWTLDSTGTWQPIPSESVVPKLSSVTGWGADGVVQLTPIDKNLPYPVVRQRNGGTWQDLGFPTGVVDTEGWSTYAFQVAARGASEVYVAGAFGDSSGYLSKHMLASWNGTRWSFRQPPPSRYRGFYDSPLAAAPSGGPVYAGLEDGQLLRLEAGASTPVPNPLGDAGLEVGSIEVDPEGDLYLFYRGVSYYRGDPSREPIIAWQDHGQWRMQSLPADWRGSGRPCVTQDGTVWWSLMSPTGSERRVISLH